MPGRSAAPPDALAAQPPAHGARRSAPQALDHEQVLGYLLVAPVVLLLLALVACPFAISVSMALTDRTIGNPGRFIGLTNIQRLFQDQIYLQTLHNTFVYTAGATVLKLVAGFGLALLINEKFRFRQLVRSAVLLPWIVPAALGTLAWLWIFAPSFSVLNWILIHLGLIKTGLPWLVDGNLALASVIVVNAWRGIPFFGITLLGRPPDDPAGALRGDLDRRRGEVRPLLVRHPAADAADPADYPGAVDHLDVFRLPDRVRPDRGGPDQQHAPAGDVELPGGHRLRAAGRRRGDLADDAAGAVVAGRPADLLPAQVGVGVILRQTAAPAVVSKPARRLDRALTVYVPLLVVLFFLLAPFYWMLITSLKPDSELYSADGNPLLVFHPIARALLASAVTTTEFPTWTRNTMVVAILATGISLLFGVPAGYSLARLASAVPTSSAWRSSRPTWSRRRCCSSRCCRW